MSLRSEVSPSLKDNSSKLGKSYLTLRLKLDNLDNVSSNPNSVDASNFKGSSSVSIEKIPSSVKLSQLKEALSVFGKISKASMRSKIKKDDCCNIQFEVRILIVFYFGCPSLFSPFFWCGCLISIWFTCFKSVESFEKAISVGVITVKNHILPIRPLLVEDTVTFRISNISSETADSTIYSMCMLYGTLEGLVRTKKGEVDALFGVKDNSDSQRILKK